MIGPLGRLGAAATLWQYCPQMTQRRCNYLDRMGHLGALRLLEPVAPGGVLGPDLAAVAVLLPELLADLLLLVRALLLVGRLVRALLPEEDQYELGTIPY